MGKNPFRRGHFGRVKNSAVREIMEVFEALPENILPHRFDSSHIAGRVYGAATETPTEDLFPNMFIKKRLPRKESFLDDTFYLSHGKPLPFAEIIPPSAKSMAVVLR